MCRIGRNSPCPCGSGKKYKRCCGSISHVAASPAPEVLQRMQIESHRVEAKEYRRRLMQGLGRPIISFESNGYRCVAVGAEIRWSKGWKTFHDFLFDYIKNVLTSEWGNSEIAKPEEDRHVLLRWYKKVCDFQRATSEKNSHGIYTSVATGVMKAYLGLAYDLYLCAHNAELQEVLLRRLRNPSQFEGALYEAYVIGCFAKAGFSIEFEDESDSTTSHCEFVATHSQTGRKYSVEAKAVSSESRRSGNSAEAPRVRDKLFKALGKAAEHPRIVFIELNRAELAGSDSLPPWVDQIATEIRQAESDMNIAGQPAPEAYVFITNRGYLHALDETSWSEFVIIEGFKISDFPPGRNATSILDAYKARERHIEVYWLQRAMGTHNDIPTTFDSRTPEEAFASEPMKRPQIGDTHLVPDGQGNEVPGVLYEAIVLEHESKVHGCYRLIDGRNVMCTFPLTAEELAVYKRQPDTFFEVVKPVSKGLKTPLDCFDFVAGSYMNSTREKLLEFMSDWPDFAEMQKLSQRELAERYCDRIATSIWNMSSGAKAN